MENDKKCEPSQNENSIVDEMITKATVAEASSDEEYISADENEDENYEVLKSINENSHDLKNIKECTEVTEQDGDNEEQESQEEVVDPDKERRAEEESLTEEEREDRRNEGQRYKDDGNILFRNGNYKDAVTEYTRALDICPLNYHKERAIMFANRAACKMKMEDNEDAISDSTKAIDLHPQYMKAVLRRAELYEKTDKLDEALKDYEAVLKLDPGHTMSKVACMRLQEKIQDRNEKLKAEMMGKLKDLGNMILRPFGLSTNNFKMEQDPNTGSYSMQFQQNPTGNGS